MSLAEVIELIILPVLAWILMNSNKTQKRLTRIETMLEILLPPHHKKHTDDD
jgi:hypothetical protein